jgi:hypothetical protein
VYLSNADLQTGVEAAASPASVRQSSARPAKDRLLVVVVHVHPGGEPAIVPCATAKRDRTDSTTARGLDVVGRIAEHEHVIRSEIAL